MQCDLRSVVAGRDVGGYQWRVVVVASIGDGEVWKFFLQGCLMVVLLSICYILASPKTTSAAKFDVTSYGAKGDRKTDDTNAFLDAWADLCKSKSPKPTLIIPSKKTFLVGPVEFSGSCESSTIHVKIMGNIVAPKTMKGWKNCVENRFWIVFTMVQGLTIDGPGQIDGQGSLWWGQTELSNMCERPTALHFHECNGLRLSGTTHLNSPFLHISIVNCQDVDIGNLQIIAPENSPNTDGIDISASSYINIHDSHIGTGDDCVAINGGIYNINVTRVFCGPGHGISIGSLGENGGYDTVEKVRVENCNITRTKNGLRIKTVPGGTGYAKGIVYQDIHLVNVENPIIIDQHYCSNYEDAFCPAPPHEPAVQVSDVSYTNIHGSSASQQAITFDCSGKFKCTGLSTWNVGITGPAGDIAYCKNAQGKFVSTSPRVRCH
uniref:probable polygalacturonase At3g15720 n=1 Tax=Erigeron canadensis TaxID=72917 RepID=UPI001CB900BC|nr:probable polygalacturonase At3g15720 [Erigeron canadensis]